MTLTKPTQRSGPSAASLHLAIVELGSNKTMSGSEYQGGVLEEVQRQSAHTMLHVVSSDAFSRVQAVSKYIAAWESDTLLTMSLFPLFPFQRPSPTRRLRANSI